MKTIVVVGGGLGGMSAAITLAKDPLYNVILIEKNKHLGGKLNVLETDGFSFDLGPSIFTMPQYFDDLFSLHGKKREDYFKLVPVTPHWRNFFEDGTVIDLSDTLEGMKDIVSKEDYKDLTEFYTYTETLYDFTNAVLFNNQTETLLQTLKQYPLFKIFKDSDFFKTMDEGVRHYIKNPKLIDIMNYFIKYVGSNPFEAPAVMNLLPYIQWKFGLWYVEGGMYQASVGLQKLMSELPIKIMTESELTSVKMEGKEIVSIEINGKKTLKVDGIVSNMEAIPFYERITKEPYKNIKTLKTKYVPACSGFALHLGVSKTYPQLAHHNFFFSTSLKQNFDNIFHNHKLSSDPTIYLVAPMHTDPTQGPKDHEIIKILPHISVLDPKRPFTKEDYMTFKDHILDKLERMGLTDLRKHIVTEELWTPETIEAMYYSNQGSIYGVEANKKKNLGFKVPKTSHLYNNLFFVGGSTNPGGGMPMVVLSGQQVKTHVDKRLKS